MSGEDIYARQQFGQKTGIGNKPALLVIDFVNGFHDPEILGGLVVRIGSKQIDSSIRTRLNSLAHAMKG